MKKKKLAKFNDRLGTENIERVCFEKIRLELTQMYRIPVSDLEGWNLEVAIREAEYGAARELAFRLKNFIVHGEKRVDKFVTVPVSWWDHLKLTLNIWAKWRLQHEHLFFTNIAKSILFLKLRPKLRNIETLTTYMRYCPHVQIGRAHV